MKKNFAFVLSLLCMIALCLGSIMIMNHKDAQIRERDAAYEDLHNRYSELEATYKNLLKEQKPATPYDCSALMDWCGEPKGSIRMVSAVTYGISVDNFVLLIDEKGDVWEVGIPMNEDEFYLLWIDDNGTEYTKDDIVIKVWMEPHF